MPDNKSKQAGTSRGTVTVDLMPEISYFAWKRGSDNKQFLNAGRPSSVRTA
jgi:hypothetical protein